jgi:predicted RNA-binding protein Jag
MAKTTKAVAKKTVKKPAAKVAATKPQPAKKVTAKKPATKAPAKKPVPKLTAKKVAQAPVKSKSLKSNEALVAENLSSLSSLVRAISETMDILVQKTENMAYHLIATEEVLAEVVATAGIDLAAVNARIRAKILKGTDRKGDPSRAIDIAASIASPRPKK